MLPIFHIIFGLILFILLYLNNLNIFYAIIFFLASFGFDIDHYIYYIFKKKSFNLIKAYKYFRVDLNKKINKKQKPIDLLLIFHTMEFIFIVFILALFLEIFQWVFLGLLFHMLVDWIYLLIKQDNKKYKRVFSLIGYVYGHKKII